MSEKHDLEKPRTDLVLGGFANALTEVAQVGTFGAKKYTDNGWREVEQPIQRYNSALMRHWLEGHRSLDDPESRLLHSAHVAWNALAVLELQLEALGLDPSNKLSETPNEER